MRTMVTRLDRDSPIRPGQERFEHFYSREFTTVAALAYVLSGSRTVAEEITQEAFEAAYREWERIGSFDRPGAWVRRVVANKAASSWRRRAAAVRAMSRLPATAEQQSGLEMSAEAVELWAAVRSLPRRQRQAVALHYVDDLPLGDVGEILGCSAGTVKTHLARARERLKRDLGTLGGEA
jgi:RNA polymerase sigma-70 factor (ECF subfamily)